MKSNNTNPSLINFLWDIFISSSIFKDYFYQSYEVLLSHEDKRNLLNNHLEKLSIWEKFYNERIEFIKTNVSIKISDDKNIPVDNVTYHPKFGWVVVGNRDKAFLGKINLLENVRLNIGFRTYFSGPGTLRGNEIVNIGKYSAIAEGSYINSSSDAHPIDYPSLFGFKTEQRLKEDGMNLPVEHKNLMLQKTGISIGHDVWLCRNVRILNGVRIGDGCVIAENAFVNRNCEPYGVYAGIPAKLIRYRFPDNIIDQLLEIKWWNWDYKKIKANTVFFDTDLNGFKGNLKNLII